MPKRYERVDFEEVLYLLPGIRSTNIKSRPSKFKPNITVQPADRVLCEDKHINFVKGLTKYDVFPRDLPRCHLRDSHHQESEAQTFDSQPRNMLWTPKADLFFHFSLKLIGTMKMLS
ncbi:hypothetical protein PAMP_023108 [Pampus punctatissimus]